MQDHWDKVGYRPDTKDMGEVDEVDVQVGRGNPEPAPTDLLRPDYSKRYSSVLINGFPKTAEEQDVYEILLEGGLPSDYKIENIKKNDKNGQLAIEDLEPSICLSLTNHIHSKKFFNRRVYVTSVVEKTPDKPAEIEVDEVEQLSKDLENSSGPESSDDESETDPASATKPPCTKLFSSIPASGKRPAKSSPEATSENSKRDKKKKKPDKSTSNSLRASSRQGKGAATKK